MRGPEVPTVRDDGAESVVAGATAAVGGPGLWRCFPLGGPPTLHFYALHSGGLRIGRSEQCAVRLLEDEKISRVHARLVRTKGGWQVADCDSTNGTHVNGQPVAEQLLTDGDLIRVGSTLFRFVDDGPFDTDRERALRATDPREEMFLGPALDGLADLLQRAADSDLALLIGGETGTGKDLAARHLHRASGRAKGPFVAINCAAVPRDLVESELFGYVKGAFSGANTDKAGLISQADGGTLFLDEIGELHSESQAKLLRVLQDHCVLAVGSTRPRPVDIRVISATNRPLRALVDHGTFRADLYSRLAELQLQLPPLRERAEEIPFLVSLFLREASATMRPVSAQAMERLCCFSWPHNIRELRAAVRRAIVLAGDAPELLAEHFALEPPVAGGQGPPAADAEAERTRDGADPRSRAISHSPDDQRMADELIDILRRCDGDTLRAAEMMGISRSQLYRRAGRLGISPARYRTLGKPQ